jgi:tryptophan halogenase
MSIAPIQKIVIVGGGTSGWMTAAAFSKLMGSTYCIELVESDEIATIGVGEATIPAIKIFNEGLGLDEDEFLSKTQGTFKLGIEFVNWGRIGESYMHGFGKIGQDLGSLSCHHYWLKQRDNARDLGEYAINTVASYAGKYLRSVKEMAGSPLGDIANAFHFDAGLYAQYLRSKAEMCGVKRSEGKIVRTELREADGFIQAVVLENGKRIEGDFFIDCSGIRALLIGQAMGVPYEDWSNWLPCNRAVAVPCSSSQPLLPYTRATAHSAGWQWRIPLQHRIGNGHVYSSRFMSEDEATSILMGNLDGEPLAEPRSIAFTPGRRTKTWHKNCVAIGLSSGFFEPIESTNIHLIQTAIMRVIDLFPNSEFSAVDIEEYNRQTQFEYEKIRDFIVLHYKVTQRDDSRFWNHCRQMDIPASLQHKINLFQSNGRVYRESSELFSEMSWIQVMHGQGLRPRSHHPLVNLYADNEIKSFLGDIHTVIQKCVAVMPTHEEYIAKHCATKK